MTSPSMPPYQRMLADARQLSYQNTVAVRNDDGVCWLGHIQDIAGDYAFIDFQSKLAPASWQHAGRLAALRDEDDGPFRFRPVTVLILGAGWGALVKDYGTTDIAPASGGSQKARMEVVDVCQTVEQAALAQPPLLYSKSLIFTKLFVSFASAQDVLCDASDKSRIIKHFCESSSRAAGIGGSFDYGRFHLHIEENGCAFISGHPPTEPPTVAALSDMLQRHLDFRAYLPAFIYGDLCGSGNTPNGKAQALNERMEPPLDDASMVHLPISLLCEIFAHLDLHSRMRVKRVCALWISLLSSRSVTEHISICLKTCSQTTKSHNLNSYKVASLLSRTVDSATKSLTLVHNFDYHYCLSYLLAGMEITVPTIILKDHTVTNNCRYPITYDRDIIGFPLNYALTWRTAVLNDCCQRVLVYNWKVDKIFGAAVFELFYFSRCEKIQRFVGLPASEVKRMAHLTCESNVGVLAADALQITIPQLILQSSDGRYHMMRRFMWGLNDNFPPVTEDIYAKVTAVHARWVRNLWYPAEWDMIRGYLTIFSGFYTDGSPKSWDDVDLRTENVRTWSRMAVFGIKDIFYI
ncbi:uncharacterized protein LOC129582867 [Paramacrobiotus metropolitanus]|uniref:uncharacterized protein LOC129582867 n=1 Tax=Paramacrobiotus metropolitanus TaxID=2943436 RepID=UPI002445BECA|nr:uncharacterized protein LOC129582867 [Paramacrobiotus metropolitanus]